MVMNILQGEVRLVLGEADRMAGQNFPSTYLCCCSATM